MLTNLYAIYDQKAEIYNKPFIQINQQVALRTCQTLRYDPNSEVYHHPEDYSMWEIGQYDDQTALIYPYEKKTLVCYFHEIPVPAEQE